MMNKEDYTAGARALLELQANCREWGQVLRRNGWDSDKMAAANTPEAKAMELAAMALIKKHRALLDDCERSFGRDPSTALRRAFDYIDIYLSRGPEALEHTVGLPECLTVEVAQPDVAEPYREPTFIVQLGRWARKLFDMERMGEGSAKGPPVNGGYFVAMGQLAKAAEDYLDSLTGGRTGGSHYGRDILKIVKGHPLHDAVVRVEGFYDSNQLPYEVRKVWIELLEQSRSEDGDSHKMAELAHALAGWAEAKATDVTRAGTEAGGAEAGLKWLAAAPGAGAVAEAESKEPPLATVAPAPPPPEIRCAPMKKTEIAARILNRTTSKNVRPREVADMMSRCALRDEGNGKWTIRLDPSILSAGIIERLRMPEWPPSLNVK